MPNADKSNSTGNDPKPAGSGGPNKGRSEKGPASNIIWYVLVLALVALLAQMWSSKGSAATDISLGDFEKGLEDKKYTADNVFKLTIGKEFITFQSQPEGAEKPGADGKAEAIKKYAVPIVGISDIDRNHLKELAKERGIVPAYERPPSELPSIIGIFALPVLLVVLLFMILRRTG